MIFGSVRSIPIPNFQFNRLKRIEIEKWPPNADSSIPIPWRENDDRVNLVKFRRFWFSELDATNMHTDRHTFLKTAFLSSRSPPPHSGYPKTSISPETQNQFFMITIHSLYYSMPLCEKVNNKAHCPKIKKIKKNI